MGTPGYAEKKARIERDTKSITDEFTAWFNSVEFENDETCAKVLREILADCTNRLQILEDI